MKLSVLLLCLVFSMTVFANESLDCKLTEDGNIIMSEIIPVREGVGEFSFPEYDGKFFGVYYTQDLWGVFYTIPEKNVLERNKETLSVTTPSSKGTVLTLSCELI